MEKRFVFRFDIDSLADMEAGVPALLVLGRELNVKFTFFVNMGKSFNWRTVLRGKKRATSGRDKGGPGNLCASHLKTMRRMGVLRTARTVIFNPDIGSSHKKMLFKLLDQGHELGLHGGMDHPLWQWKLDALSKNEINDILKPAYDDFMNSFGKPAGFTSPGFKYNRFVLELVDDYGFDYSSDMAGEEPFIPAGCSHLQVPVNLAGPGGMPLIESLLSSGHNDSEVLYGCIHEVAKRETAVIYGHPACEGRFKSLGNFLGGVMDMGYEIMPMREIAHSSGKGV